MNGLIQRFDRICERLERAFARTGRPSGSLRLVAISKTHGPDAVAALAAHWAGRGRPLFGESYMQEAREKMPAVAAQLASAGLPAPEWHFVGHVQRKKAKDIVGAFSLIHSLDSLKLAQAMQKAWQDRVLGAPIGLDEAAPRPQEVLVQVNVGREEQKSGVAPEELESLLNALSAMSELRVTGLMCLPPLGEIGEHSRPYFILLRQLRDKMESRCGLSLPQLSMGMSDDFEAAIEEGATLVRIGTDIFGQRQ
ncbi:YggS family pyridoxal phosphate-dependent enzyme [Desulfovibrio sp. OttesenSCG-928-M16]|nr:YggS family pyridoxal phosphate-dependent enzyme [Desulfovibrio sp. OttesenSCG-928-M16]